MKHAELEKHIQKNKGKKQCSGGDSVEDDYGFQPVFTEQSASAVAQFSETISRSSEMAGEAKDAISAHTQVRMKGAHKLLNQQEMLFPSLDKTSSKSSITRMGQHWRPCRTAGNQPARPPVGKTIMAKIFGRLFARRLGDSAKLKMSLRSSRNKAVSISVRRRLQNGG